MQCGFAEDAGGPAADVDDGRIGHPVADLMRQQWAAGFNEGHRIARVMSDQFSIAIERQADVRVAIRILQIFPTKVFERTRRVKRAREEIEDGTLIARLIRPGEESLVSG